MTQPPIDALINVMAALRHPESGCPWDREQSFATIAPYTVEEAYEVQSAIIAGDQDAIREELGDLLFQVVYHSRLAQERGWFDFNGVAQTITDKMIRRHPHVFAGAAREPHAWESQKAAERAAKRETSILAGIATALPALIRAEKLTARAARVGFDWPTPEAVLDKLAEETAELRAELPAADPARLRDEVGDMLFVLANLARKLGLSAEACLAHANAKFTCRFTYIETQLAARGLTPANSNLTDMDQLWNEAKSKE